MSILLDTNVLSELLRASPDQAVLAWFAAQPPGSLFVSAVTEAEMLLGVELLPAGNRRKRLQQAVEATFREDFDARLLPFDALAARAFARIVAGRRKVGRPISQFDAQIAAVAVVRGLGLATRNENDFEGCGVVLYNPWNHLD